jgi:hypothetical protein
MSGDQYRQGVSVPAMFRNSLKKLRLKLNNRLQKRYKVPALYNETRASDFATSGDCSPTG